MNIPNSERFKDVQWNLMNFEVRLSKPVTLLSKTPLSYLTLIS